MIITRCLSGALNGNVAVGVFQLPASRVGSQQASLCRWSELAWATSQMIPTRQKVRLPISHTCISLFPRRKITQALPLAFAMYGLVWTVGSIIGNTIGGTFSHPVERIPWLFKSSTLLERYPFLLPCLITTGFTGAGLLFAWFFLEEVSLWTMVTALQASMLIVFDNLHHRAIELLYPPRVATVFPARITQLMPHSQ